MKRFQKYFAISSVILSLSINEALACANHGISNVGNHSLIPGLQGGTISLQYDHINQRRNWSDNKKSNKHNHDNEIDTKTVTFAGQYMFNRDFGVAVRVPFVTRSIDSANHNHQDTFTRYSNIGDVSVSGIYSGFFDDMSTGLTLGVKLPTGRMDVEGFNRNTQIGTGSTDIALGAYHMGNFGNNHNFGYFGQIAAQKAVIIDNGYRPGDEISGAVGVFYNLGTIKFAKKVAPIMQVTGTKKRQDAGSADPSHNADTGYSQMFFSPGLEVAIKDFKVYGDIQFPFYRSVEGTQLVPQNIYKLMVSYNF